MEKQMLRSVLERLRNKKILMECKTSIDPKFELGAVLNYFHNEQPILFPNVKGYNMPVAAGLYGNRKNILDLLGASNQDRIFKFAQAIAAPQKYRLISQGAVQEKVITDNINLLKMLPVPTSNARDASPYLCAGMLVLKDFETGRTNMAVRRIQVNRGNTLNVLVSGASPRLNRHLVAFREQKKTLECAIVLGYDPFFLFASQISSEKYELDKYEVDSSLRGEPLEVVRCRTVNLEVPAWAEIVLEGVISPGKMNPEGPFAELMGYYSTVAPAPVMEVTAVTHRNNPIFQHAFPCKEEHLAYGMIKEAEIFAAAAHTIDIQDINLTIGGGCRLHAVASIRKRSPGDGKSAILSILGTYKDVKHVIIVDEDIDIYNMDAVEGAIASRVQATRDLVIIPGALGSLLEASHTERGITDKVGIDATKPLGEPARLYETAAIPGFDANFDIKKYFD